MSRFLALAGAAAVIAVGVGVFAIAVPRSPGGIGGIGVAPTPSSSPTPSATPASPPPSPDPLDTQGWTTYMSSQYGFSIGHPAGWKVVPATRDWTFGTDAGGQVQSPGADHFTAADDSVRASVWTLAVDPATTIDTWAKLEAWVEGYCRMTNNAPCTGIPDRAVPMCLEKRDCHPAVIVPFTDDVQAFFVGGGRETTIVAVWRPESDPSVARFGGSRRLLEALLSTTNVFPPSGPDNHP